MQETQKSTSSILRALLKGIVSDSKIFANSTSNVILQNYPIIDTACRGNISIQIILIISLYLLLNYRLYSKY
jgi:hypothetical protein